ncbi:UDP-N-acetylmuramate dehydrogenase [Pseudoalteromonas sp. AS84]|uniref:UDP-N-acetylmuramate dehydrogenase n=1 Tax=Pseudoalteromonas sp. AS84 TaxID=3135778 RepID=UPI00316CC82E
MENIASNKSISKSFIKKLLDINEDSTKEDVSLAEFSRWKVGGNAKCIFTPTSIDELIHVVKIASELNQPYIVIGSTSNLLFADEGLDILAINLGSQLSNVSFDKCNEVTVEAGAWVPGFARTLSNNGLSGLEHTAGIPGTIGGLICMNGGSMRKGIGENVLSVTALTRDGLVKQYSQSECSFAYRTSVFQKNNEIILSAVLKLNTLPSKQIKKQMLSILRSRRHKFPLKLPNCGSVFVSNPAMYEEFGPPGAVIEKCGLKGKQAGGAEISPLHANFIVNKHGAKASDILTLVKLACESVKRETGYHMVSEVRFVTSFGGFIPAHEVHIND